MRRRPLFIVVAVAAALAACEIGLRAAARYSGYVRYQLSSPYTRNLVPDPERGFRTSPYTPGHDRRGYRNPEALDKADILAIGDSVTYGLGAFADGSWPRQLAQLEGTSVYNAGVGGYGPCEYIAVLNELLPLKPRVVIVGLYMGNDVGNAYASVYIQRRCRDFRSADPSVLAAIQQAEAKAAVSQLAAEYGDVRADENEGGWMQQSALYSLGRSLVYAIATRNQLPNREGRPDSYETAAAEPFRVPMPSPPAFRTVFREPRLELLAIDQDDVRMAEGLRVALRAIDDLDSRASVGGAKTLVAVLHSKAYSLSPVIREQPEALRRQFERQIAEEERATQAVLAALQARGLHLVDTGEAMRAAAAEGRMLFHDSDDSHPTAQGYAVIAKAIQAALPR